MEWIAPCQAQSGLLSLVVVAVRSDGGRVDVDVIFLNWVGDHRHDHLLPDKQRP